MYLLVVAICAPFRLQDSPSPAQEAIPSISCHIRQHHQSVIPCAVAKVKVEAEFTIRRHGSILRYLYAIRIEGVLCKMVTPP